jgi:hypothetical protein
MNVEVQRAVIERGITRLCHFTPSRNLSHIACDAVGVLATKQLKANERLVFNPTDLARLDGHDGFICCSIEYPNPWYFEKARAKELLFKDWVVLLINPACIWRKDSLFCPRNAAAGCGRELKVGIEGFTRLYAKTIIGAYGKRFERSSRRLPSVPTDDQAEILIADQIQHRDILTVAVRDEEQARNELSRLRILNHETAFRFVIAPDLFDKNSLSGFMRDGARPPEKELK